MIEYLIYFIFYGLFGWLVEFLYDVMSGNSLKKYLHQLPPIPLYGLGGIIVISLIPILSPYNVVIKFLTYAVSLSVLEYFADILAENGVGTPWNYKSKFNISGRTDLFHAISWGILGLMVEYVLHPFISHLIL